MSAPQYRRSIVWLRRDLRLSDNRALYEAARGSDSVCIAFVINPQLLRSERMGAPLVQSFFGALAALRADLRARGSDLALLEGDFSDALLSLAGRIGATAVFANEDYEPRAVTRDAAVQDRLRASGIEVRVFTDHVYFGADEVAQTDGRPYKIFTPYKRRWLEQRAVAPRPPVPSARAIEERLLGAATIGATREVPAPEDWGFQSRSTYPDVSEAIAHKTFARFLRAGGAIDAYREQRDFPAVAGTSRLSPQLRAGTIGIRTCVEGAFHVMNAREPIARANIETWIGELIWRDFYQMVLKRWPHVENGPFVDAAKNVPWRTSESDFQAWCDGMTGYPIVDAAMRQLNAYGWMHNRLRMIVASFLAKDLLIDWRKGERHFERRLADADLAQNNGGWQWSAGTGTDAAPYFRVLNPVLQSEKFDPGGVFIRAMVPELRSVPNAYIHAPWKMPPLLAREANCEIGKDYPRPLVDHAEARKRALAAFATAP